jgi:PAS domain S-box-containing protein
MDDKLGRRRAAPVTCGTRISEFSVGRVTAMKAAETIGLHRLLRPRDAAALLESLAALAPTLGLAVLRSDRQLLASAGRWPEDLLRKVSAMDGGAPPADCRSFPLLAGEQHIGDFVVRVDGSDAGTARVLHDLLLAVLSSALEKREIAAEALQGYREVNLLYRVTATVGRSLDTTAIPQLMLHESKLITADAGLVLLGDVAASFGGADNVATLHDTLQRVIDSLWQTERPAILTDAPGPGSPWGALLWAPLRGSDGMLGGIVLARRLGRPIFTSNDEKLLMALAGPSALALENARLFSDLQQTLKHTLETKSLLDNVLASIASGVLTTDLHRQITLCNDAAARILGLPQTTIVGRPLAHALPAPFSRLAAIIGGSADRGAVTPASPLSVTVPGRGPLHLFVSCAPLRDAAGGRNGAAAVINDLTEQHRIEAERERIKETFGRVVAPRVRDRLLADPSHLRLDGERHTVTVLFADLHDFTPFSERTDPEQLFKVLNSYLAIAAQAVLDEEGTLDKFLGDAVMAFWNAPDAQPDHALRATRAALAMQRALEAHRGILEGPHRLHFSTGISTGTAIVGNIGTGELFNYTAIGDTVNLAQRLESIAEPGRILLSEATYRDVAAHVAATPRPPVQVKGRQQPVVVYDLTGLT